MKSSICFPLGHLSGLAVGLDIQEVSFPAHPPCSHPKLGPHSLLAPGFMRGNCARDALRVARWEWGDGAGRGTAASLGLLVD